MKNPGRCAGLLYLIGSIPGFFALLYVPGRLFVHGNLTATAHNIASHQTLFRWSIFADLLGQVIFIFVALVLYNLLRGISHRLAVMMLLLYIVSVPICFCNELNSIAALDMARGADFLGVMGEIQRLSLMRLFLNLRHAGFEIAGIFWGLWLFPMGLLVYRSGFIPRILGVLLMAGCCAYLANSFAALVYPAFEDTVDRWASPVQLVEVIFMLWLLIVGAMPRKSPRV